MSAERYTAPADPALRTAEAEARATVRRISWGAVLAGVIIALVVQLLLSMLGVGIGASTIDPASGTTPEASSLGIGAGIWYVISALLAVFAGGWVAGRLAGVPVRLDGLLHGLVTWGLATLVVIYLLTTAISGLIGGAFGVVGSALQTAGQAAQGAAQGAAQTGDDQGALAPIREQITGLMAPAVQQTQEAIDQARQAGQQIQSASEDPQVRAALERAVTAGPDQLAPSDREAAISGLVRYAGMSRPEAEQQLTQWQQTYQQARQQAVEAGTATADAVTSAALWSFVALALGAIVGAVGGMIGAPRLHDGGKTAAAGHAPVRTEAGGLYRS